jgi:hypothetical protein
MMSQASTDPTMSFGTAIVTVFRNYAEFRGRAGRVIVIVIRMCEPSKIDPAPAVS